MESQRENDSSLGTKRKVVHYCDLIRVFKIASYKETQKGSSVSSGIKLMSRRNIYKRGRNSEKKINRNSRAEEINKLGEECIRSIGSRAEDMEERVSEFKERNLEMIQVEEERESRSKNKRGNSIRTI